MCVCFFFCVCELVFISLCLMEVYLISLISNFQTELGIRSDWFIWKLYSFLHITLARSDSLPKIHAQGSPYVSWMDVRTKGENLCGNKSLAGTFL